MGQATDEFVKYPRTPHLHNPKLLEFLLARQKEQNSSKPVDDKMLSLAETLDVISKDDVTYVWESKLDGTNVGISFFEGKIFLQNRGHELKAGEHPQYSLFRNWAYTVMLDLQEILGDRYIMFGEWLNALHSIEYRTLPHYFFEFDIWDKKEKYFFDTELRSIMLEPLAKRNVLQQVPVVKTGRLSYEEAMKLIQHPPYFGEDAPEGLYLKVEQNGRTVGRYKLVRPDFVQAIIEGNDEGEDHWSHKSMRIQGLAPGVDITKPVP